MKKKDYKRPMTEVYTTRLDVSMMQSTGGGGSMPPGQEGEDFPGSNSRRIRVLDDEDENVLIDDWALRF